MSTTDSNYDAAHEADIRELMCEQLESNISAEEAIEELEERENNLTNEGSGFGYFDEGYDDDFHGQPEESLTDTVTDTEAVAWVYKKLLDYRVESASMDNALMMDRLKNLLMGY